MWITQEPKKVALRNKRHFEEKNGAFAASFKYSVLIFFEKIYIKCNIWGVAIRPSYMYDARFLKVKLVSCHWSQESLFFWLALCSEFNVLVRTVGWSLLEPCQMLSGCLLLYSLSAFSLVCHINAGIYIAPLWSRFSVTPSLNTKHL